MDKKWLPTGEQLEQFEHCYGATASTCWSYFFDKKGLAKFTAKKIAERGNEPCPHYKDWSKHSCSECWQELLKEIGES